MTTPRIVADHARRIVVTAFGVVTLALIVGGYLYYRQEAREIREAAYQNLATVGKLKAKEIDQWRAERQEDAQRLAHGSLTRKAVVDFLRHPDDVELRAVLRQHLRVEQEVGRDDDALLLAPDGALLLAAKSDSNQIDPALQRAITAALTHPGAVISDFYRNQTGGVCIDAVAAVRDDAGQPLAVVVLRRNPNDYLYPLIQSVPMTSRSAETVLFQQEGAEVFILNVLRHVTNAPLALRFPLTRTNLPAVQGALGKQGMFKGEDYRGVTVLTDIRQIPGSSWIMITKMDWDEATYEEYYRGAEIAFIVGLFTLLGLTACLYHQRLTRVFLNFSDVEQRKLAAQEKYRATLYSIGDGVITTDTAGRVQEMNPVAQKLTGWSQREAEGKPLAEIFRLISEAARKPLNNPADEVLRNGEIFGLPDHALLIARDGTERSISDSAAPVCDANGSLTGVVLVFRDQTRQHAAQQAQREGEERLRIVTENARVGLVMVNRERRYIYANTTYTEILDLPSSDIKGKYVAELLAPIYETQIRPRLDRAFAGERVVFELEMPGTDGDRFYLVRYEPLKEGDSVASVVVVITDITESKQAEAALVESEAEFRAAFEQAAVGMAQVAPDGHWRRVNQRLCEIVGYSRAELLGKTFQDITHPEDLGPDLALVQRLLAGELQTYTLEKRYIRKDGSVVPVNLTVALARDASGKPDYFISVIEDITKRKQAEQSLELSRSLLSATLESTEDGILVVDAQGKVASFNQKFLTLWQLPATLTPGGDDQVQLGMVLEQLAEPAEFLAKVDELYRHPEAVSVDEFEFRDGRYIERYSLPQRLGDRIVGRVWSFRDITERKQAEVALQHRERILEAVGVAAARFLSASDWRTTVPEVLEHLGKATEVSRVVVWQAHPGPDGATAISQRREWRDDDVPNRDDDPTLQNLPLVAGGFGRWGEVLGQGEVIQGLVRDFPVSEQGALNSHHILAIAVVPVMVSNQWWGFMAFDECSVERSWRPDEIEALRAAARIFGEAVQREQAEAAVRASEEQFRTMFELASIGMAQADPKTGQLLRVNEKMSVITGYSRDELLGIRFPEITHPDDRQKDWEAFQRVMRGEASDYHGDKRYVCKDGRIAWVNMNVTLIRNEAGQPLHSMAAIEDITERKQAEAALLESQVKFSKMFNSSPVATSLTTVKDGRYLDVNDAFLRMFEWSRSEVVGHTVLDLNMWVDLNQRATLFSRLQEQGAVIDFEMGLRTKSGQVRQIMWSGAVLDIEGEPCLIGSAQDITERKQAQLALLRNETVLLEAQRLAKLGNWEWNTETGSHFWSPEIFRIYGRDPELGPADFEEVPQYFTPESWAHLSAEVKSALADGSPYECDAEVVRPDGTHRWITARGEPVRDASGKITGLHGTVQDITERKQAEEEIVREQGRFKLIFDTVPLGIALATKQPDGTFTRIINDAHLRICGLTREQDQIPGIYARITHPDDLTHQIELGGPAGEGKVNQLSMEKRYIRPDGTVVWVDFSFQRRDFDDGGYQELTTVVDITQRKVTEESHARLATAVEQAAESIVITDTRGTMLYANPAFEKTSGYTGAEVIGQNPRILKSGRQDDEFYRRMWTVLKRGEVWSGHFSNRRKDGTIYEEEATISPIRGTDGKIKNYVAVKRDVTRETQLESQFRQAQKMEAFGQLAGGVAHDFNNILGIIMMQAGLLKTITGELPEATAMAADISKAAERGANLTRQLLLFSRRQTLQPHNLDLNDSVASITKMLRRIVGEDIQMQLKYAAHPLWVHADPGMLDQVMMNLTVNARDAMPQGGHLFIETTEVDWDEFAALQSPHGRPGSFVCLSVTDTGCGISPETLPRIFEPFFTTKEVGKGTGLGLATVFGIVQQHDGWVDVYSELGLGTTFRVYLPRLAQDAEAKAKTAMEPSIHTGDETILFVEDEMELRAVVRKSLTRLGYRVLEAANSKEAIALWHQHRSEIQLLLTDMVMPGGMNGKELARQLQSERPELKVIFASGYSVEVAGTDLQLHEGVNFLPKPFVMHKLAGILRAQLA